MSHRYEPSIIVAKLREYNCWRRGDDDIKQPDPFEIGGYIDDICDIVEKLIRERNEIKEKYDTLAVENMLEVNKLYNEKNEDRKVATGLAEQAERLRNERDEAREELNRYKRQWEESRSENVEGAK